MLGLQLFTICTNDLGEGSKCTVAKFAVDTKIGGKTSCERDTHSLQKDINSLSGQKIGKWNIMWESVTLYILEGRTKERSIF